MKPNRAAPVRLVQIAMIIFICLFTVGATGLPSPIRVAAQTTLTCGNVIDALQQSLAACTKTQAGMVCAGSMGVKLELADAKTEDLAPGAEHSWSAIHAIQTAPLALDAGQWGTALLRVALQNPDGNLLKQSALFMLYGDARLALEAGAGTPTPVPENPFHCSATTTRAAQVRALPNTNGAILDTLAVNETITLLGVSADGNWLFTDGKTKAGWISKSNLKSDCDFAKLTVLDPKAPATFGNLPTLILKADGTDTNACRDVPPAGLLVQAPLGRPVQFSLNGSLVTVTGSAVFMAKPNNALRGSLITGSLSIQSNGKSQIVDEGQQVSIPLGRQGGLRTIGAPSKPVAVNEFRGDNAIYLNTLCLLNKPFDGGLPCRITRPVVPSAVPGPTSGGGPVIP